MPRTAEGVQRLERRVQRDAALVVAGALMGLGIGQLVAAGVSPLWLGITVIGVILLALAAWMKR